MLNYGLKFGTKAANNKTTKSQINESLSHITKNVKYICICSEL